MLLCAFTLPGLFGANVSCIVIETGLPATGPKSQYSAMWENSLMDVLFETGHIASNGRIMRLARKPEGGFPIEAERDFEEAKETGMDYFLVAIIEQPEKTEPAGHRSVYLRLFSTKSRVLINEQVYEDNKPKNAKEENENMKQTIGLIVAQIK